MLQTLVVNRAILIVAILMLSYQSLAQTTELNGFYFSLSNKKNCSSLIPTLDNQERYCTSTSPIINASEFESIGKIQVEINQKSVVLKLTENGFKTWQGILKNMPDAILVLVVDGYVVGKFKNEARFQYASIAIYAPADSKDLEWICDHLKKTP